MRGMEGDVPLHSINAIAGVGVHGLIGPAVEGVESISSAPSDVDYDELRPGLESAVRPGTRFAGGTR
jgi:hypothetical protein